MRLKITARRQVTFPARILEALGVGPGDRLELVETKEGLLLKPCKFDFSKLAPLRGKLDTSQGPFDAARFRDETYNPSLGD